MAVGTGETKIFLANGAILAAPGLKGPRNTIAFFQVSSDAGGRSGGGLRLGVGAAQHGFREANQTRGEDVMM